MTRRKIKPGAIGTDVDLDAEEVYLGDGRRLTEQVAEEMAEHPDATHEECVFARTMQSNVNTYFNPPLAVFRVATQSLAPEN